MRYVVLVCLMGVMAVGCSEDKDDDIAPGVRDLCAAQCDRADECGFLEGSKPGQCQSDCESVQTSLASKDCSFKDGELRACADAFSAQQCSEIQNAEVPEACMKTCQVTRD